MDSITQETIRAAEEAVRRLIEACAKPGPLYSQKPKAAAQVSRNAKWLLNATARLRQELSTPAAGQDAQAS